MMKPPSKELCLYMAQHHFNLGKRKDLMWDWLMCWAAYDDWLELYWGKK